LKVLTQVKPEIKISGFDDLDIEACPKSQMFKRRIIDRLETKMVVFQDRIEVRCQIGIGNGRLFDVILPIEL
jgi:hypothetical protein